MQEFCHEQRYMPGIKYYELPVIETPVKVKDFVVPTGKKVGCYDDQRCMGYILTPGPIYVAHDDYMKSQQQSPNKGKYGKYKKFTFTEEVFKREQFRMSPV